MLTTMAVLLLAAMPQTTIPPAEPLSVQECLKRITARVPLTTVEPVTPDLVGVWTKGGHLSGSLLYFFDDHSYIATEWADILPETIFHKGSWGVADGALVMSLDSDVTWREPRDQRFVLYTTKSSPEKLLFGLDFTLEVFEKLVAEKPRNASTWLKFSSFKRDHPWKPGEAEARKATLMKHSWNPAYFSSPE